MEEKTTLFFPIEPVWVPFTKKVKKSLRAIRLVDAQADLSLCSNCCFCQVEADNDPKFSNMGLDKQFSKCRPRISGGKV